MLKWFAVQFLFELVSVRGVACGCDEAACVGVLLIKVLSIFVEPNLDSSNLVEVDLRVVDAVREVRAKDVGYS